MALKQSRRTVDLPTDLYDRLEARAAALGTSPTRLLGDLLERPGDVALAAVRAGMERARVRRAVQPRPAITAAETAAFVEAFRVARALADREALYRPGSEPASTCRYCGYARSTRLGTGLDGHALCIVPADFLEFVLGVLETHPALTLQAMAAVIGVSKTTVRAWYRAAIDGRARRRAT